MATNIQLRRGTSTEWTSSNPILAVGEVGLETDTKFIKVGDGVTAWNSLAYGGIQGQVNTDVTNSGIHPFFLYSVN